MEFCGHQWNELCWERTLHFTGDQPTHESMRKIKVCETFVNPAKCFCSGWIMQTFTCNFTKRLIHEASCLIIDLYHRNFLFYFQANVYWPATHKQWINPHRGVLHSATDTAKCSSVSCMQISSRKVIRSINSQRYHTVILQYYHIPLLQNHNLVCNVCLYLRPDNLSICYDINITIHFVINKKISNFITLLVAVTSS